MSFKKKLRKITILGRVWCSMEGCGDEQPIINFLVVFCGLVDNVCIVWQLC